MEIDAEALRAAFNYDPETGIFTRKTRTSNRIKVGQQAGSINQIGYRMIGIGGRKYLAHRLAWLYVTGREPVACIDHINMVRDDNRFCNLREATNAENHWNIGKFKSNKSGFKGVNFCKSTGRWAAKIKAGDTSRFIGRFDTPQEAYAAYCAAAAELHGRFANTGAAA